MATNKVQVTLDRILEGLKSSDSEGCLQALEELNTLNFSSPAILNELERLALHHRDKKVRTLATASLGTSVHQYVRSSLNALNRGDRAFVLKQIELWEKDRLLPSNIANVIRARYDFDIATPQATPAPAPLIKKPSTPLPVPAQPAVPAAPRPTLTQTLLSEASIRIYLYLGAFFVIAAALILAAVVEAARLPILAAATLFFGGGALLLRKRLPQPSFAIFIVFSFLLLIDANVLEESIGLRGPALSIYWTILWLTMASIWGLSIWFYESRFFSVVAFVSLNLGFYRAAEIFQTAIELNLFFLMIGTLFGLGGVHLLTTWKDHKFSGPVFWVAQLQTILILITSFGWTVLSAYDTEIQSGWWFVISLTWLTAAVFFALSNLIFPAIFLPWMAVGALLPLPWFLFRIFDATLPGYGIGFFAWGAVLVLGSELVFRLPIEKSKPYHWPLLAGSVPLLLTAAALALIWNRPTFIFSILALTAVVYGTLYWVRPRWYVWSAALLSALSAVFMFFQLPIIEKLAIPFVYQLLTASILLVVPELFTQSPLSLKSEWRWCTIVLGIFVSLSGILAALTDLQDTGRGALVLIIYAVLFTLHAFHIKHEWLGYLAAALESLALLYALDHFRLDLWLPALTILSIIYYAAGFFFRRIDGMQAWGNVFINSGLALGLLLSLTCIFLQKEASGWFILLIALLFAVEVFARPWAWLELAVEVLLSISFYRLLDDFNITGIGHFLFGASLIWLGSDLIFGKLIQQKRMYRPIVLGAGYVLVAMAALALWGELRPEAPMIYFLFYAGFFAVYAFLQREPRLGYLASAFLPLAIIRFADLVNFEKWIFPLIVLSVLYYASGYWLRQNKKGLGWDRTLLSSGLALGVLTSLSAPLQGGLDSSIPVAVAATLFAIEAFALRNVWWALPANALYLISYFIILWELNVDEPQLYSIGAALLGMLMHFLLIQAGSRTGAFIAGMLSQLVLLGTTYIQMVSTEKLWFFFVLFIQSMVVLVYGLVQRSRSLVITPIAFAVVGVMTVVYSALKGLGPVILIGSTGVLLLTAGIVAVLMRERITRLGEQLSDWKP